MNIFLTGGSGFIGKNITEQMSRYYKIYAPSHKELDLMDEEAVRQFFLDNKINVVIHAAIKPCHRNAQDFSELVYSNARMFFNIIRNSDLYDKIIFLSSGAVYDMRHYKPKMTESYFDEHVPTDENGFYKYISAKHLEKLENAIELRVFGIFGKYEDYAIRFIANAICKTLFDLPITIRQNRIFDYLYIDDFMPVLDYFIKNKVSYTAYNVTPTASIDLYSIAEKVRAISGKDLPIIVGQPGMGPEYSGDNQRLREEIPTLKFTPMDDAIRQLYKWYETNIQSIKREVLLFDK